MPTNQRRSLASALLPALALLLGVAAHPARAQAAPVDNPLRRGVVSLMAGVSPDLEVGVWRMVSDRTSVGLAVGGIVEHMTSDGSGMTSRLLTVGPQFKHYGSTTGTLLPYLHGGASVGTSEFRTNQAPDQRENRSTNRLLTADLAVGLDWFPVRRISLGGYTGLRASVLSNRSRSSSGSGNGSEWRVGTFTSGIGAHLYF